MQHNNYSLVQFQTADDYLLAGLFSAGSKNKMACVFVHGFTTDFYSHSFYHTMTTALAKHGHAVLLAQNRGTGVQTEILKVGKPGVFIGSYFERLEDAHSDISACIEFLHAMGYKKICLIGHSLGTIKVVRYLSEGLHKNSVEKIVLLAPFDKNAYMERKMPGKLAEYVEKAKKKVAAKKGNEQVPIPEFEDYAVSYHTYVSWYEESELNSMWDFYRVTDGYDFPVLRKIPIPTRVVLGAEDDFVHYPEFGVTAPSVLETIKKYVQDCKTELIPNCNHTFTNHEDELALIVQKFVAT